MIEQIKRWVKENTEDHWFDDDAVCDVVSAKDLLAYLDKLDDGEWVELRKDDYGLEVINFNIAAPIGYLGYVESELIESDFAYDLSRGIHKVKVTQVEDGYDGYNFEFELIPSPPKQGQE